MVGSKEKMKKKCPSAQMGSPDYIHTCSRANVLTLQQIATQHFPKACVHNCDLFT